MLEYTMKTVKVVAGFSCDRCKRRFTPEDREWHEHISISYQGGYDSIFGDGNFISIDLCQHCVSEVLGPWLRITAEPVDN